MVASRKRTGRPAKNPRVEGLTDDDVRRIRERVAAGERLTDLAIEHGLGVGYVSHLARGSIRKEAGGPITEPSYHIPRRRPPLPEEIVVQIRERRAAGERANKLAAEYGIGPGHISAITTGQIYANVGGPISPPRWHKRGQDPKGAQDRRRTASMRYRMLCRAHDPSRWLTPAEIELVCQALGPARPDLSAEDDERRVRAIWRQVAATSDAGDDLVRKLITASLADLTALVDFAERIADEDPEVMHALALSADAEEES